MLKDIIQARAGGRVERLHIMPHRQGYTNAAHSWGVGMIMLKLWPEDFPRLAEVCLTHDVPEYLGGDIPSPIFQILPGVKKHFDRLHNRINSTLGLASEGELDELDLAKLKACDLIEFYLFCREEYAFGNDYVYETIKAMEAKYRDGRYVFPTPADKLFEEIRVGDILPSWHKFMEEHASELGEIEE